MINLNDIISKNSWAYWEDYVHNVSRHDVETSLNITGKHSIQDFANLISASGEQFINNLAAAANQKTIQRFGRTVQLYAPMYLSNECQNICTYCGFSFDHKIQRKTLTDSEIIQEAEFLKLQGFDHILLVTGEANKTVGTNYIANAVKLLQPYFSQIAIEIQPLDTDEYKLLVASGVHTVLVYQETYNRNTYKEYHTKGKKSNYQYRLETADRLGEAGIHKIGLGALLGLDDWRVDSIHCALHFLYLRQKFPCVKFSISFPRLRPAVGVKHDENKFMTDVQLAQLIATYRLLDINLELSISTREAKKFRDNIFKLGITSMSAGSKTNPGGYTLLEQELEQFEIDDDRSVQEIYDMLTIAGYEPVWKDWDQIFHIN
ncbi:MAG: 2-iminoacetate synthase ThiH [Bacteroidota bacterium]|nr:2-iminoacetate synthase ThiH [Bacteroidota bacterium]